MCLSCRASVWWSWAICILTWVCCCGAAAWCGWRSRTCVQPTSPCSWWPFPWSPDCCWPRSSNTKVGTLNISLICDKSVHWFNLNGLLCFTFLVCLLLAGASFKYSVFYLLGLALPYVHFMFLIWVVFEIFTPIMGRSGTEIPPEVVLASLVTLTTIFLSSYFVRILTFLNLTITVHVKVQHQKKRNIKYIFLKKANWDWKWVVIQFSSSDMKLKQISVSQWRQKRRNWNTWLLGL